MLQTMWQVLTDAGIVRLIAETLLALHQKKSKTNATLKALESKRATALKASKNLIAAIEQGIITEQTKIRMKELENEIAQLDVDIEQEKLHSYTYLTVEMIEKYLRMATFGDVEDISFRKSLVNTYIREVIYYPDKIIITMNFTDTYDKHDITPESVKEIEKQSASEAAFQKDMSSYSLAFPPPSKPHCFKQ